MDCERLLARLENFDTDGLHRDFIANFEDLIQLRKDQKSKKNAKKTGRKSAKEDSQIRPLAKRFLPALSRMLKICPDLLSTPSKDGDACRCALEVFQIFKMALDCFECISPCLDAKPFDVDLQRYRLVRRFEAWNLHDDARDQAYLILNNLRKVFSDEDRPDDTEEDVPCLFSDRAANTNPELGLLVVEAVATIVRCAFKSKCKEIREYRKILAMTEQLRPWLSTIDGKHFEKYHGILLHALYNCTRFIIGESSYFKGDLVSHFCKLAIAECVRSQSGDMVSMVVHGLLSSLGSHCENIPSVFLYTMEYALDAMVCKCKHGVIYFINHILDIVSFCMSSLRNASNEIQKDASLLCDASGRSCQVLSPYVAAVLTLYSAGLFITTGDVLGSSEESVVSVEAYDCKVERQNYFITLSASIRLINSDTSGCQLNEAEGETSTRSSVVSKSHSKGNGICTLVHGKVSLMSYLKGLAFFCKPFGEYAQKEWKHMKVKNEMLSSGSIILILDTLHLFCNAFMLGFSNLSVKERERMRKGFFTVAMAALRISVISDRHSEETLKHIKCIVSQDWIQPRELKFIISTLYSVGFSKYKENQLDKASLVLEVCYHASWTLASLFGGRYVGNSKRFSDHNLSITEAEGAEFVGDACSKSAFYVDVLHQSGNPSKRKIVVESLLNWSDVVITLERISSPKNLVKQWAKSVCEDFKDSLPENAPTLHSILKGSNVILSNKILGIILEEEVLAYAELDSRNLSFCRSMQEKIIQILLTDVYDTTDFYVQRARVLIIKSRAVLANNPESLKISIEVLTQAICALRKSNEAHASDDESAKHLLALTYCLRALFSSEAYNDTLDFLLDICAALKLWSSMMVSTQRFHYDQFQSVIIKELPLLYHIADLLAVKGLRHLQSDILMLIIMLSVEKGIPLEESLGAFCQDRRLTHSFCMSPVEKEFLLNLEQQFDVSSSSLAFWIRCVEREALSMHGFCQKFFLSDLIINQSDLINIFEGPILASLNTIEEMKASANTLISKDSIDYHSAVSAGHLYYDLSDRLLSSGQLIEALLYSRKALQLRTNLLQRFFTFSIEKQPTTDIDVCESMLDNKSYHVHLEAHATTVKELLLDSSKHVTGLRSFLSHWSVLQYYLESSLQVAILHDMVGNGDDAEYHFLVGKRVSKLRGLKLFEVLFCSWLGHTYRRKCMWDLAEKELVYGKGVLMESSSTEFCNLCKLALGATLEFRLADLIRSRFEQTGKESLVPALEHYMLAWKMLESFRWDVTCLHCHEPYPAIDGARDCAACSGSKSNFGTCAMCLQADMQVQCKICASWKNYVILKGTEQNHSRTISLDVKNETEQLNSILRPRKSRSTKPRSSKNLAANNELVLDTSKPLHKAKRVPATRSSKRDHVSISNHQKGFEDAILHLSENQNLPLPCRHKISQLHDKDHACVNAKVDSDQVAPHFQTDCWRCFIFKMTTSGKILDAIVLKLEHHRRSLLLRLSIQMGKCKRMLGKVHEAHDIFCQSACLLFHRSVSSEASDCLHHFIHYFGKQRTSDLFTIDHALLLYHISWFCLDHHLSDKLKTCDCGLKNVQVQSVVTLLEHAFIICREVPLLFRKVASCYTFSFSTRWTFLFAGEKRKCSFFVPLGCFLSSSLSWWLSSSSKSHCSREKREHIISPQPQEPHFMDSDHVLVELSNSLRLAPTCLDDLERFVIGFFQRLPAITVTCISLLGGDDANLLGEMSLLPCAPFSAWIFLSRLARGRQPASFLLPMDVISQDDTGSNISLVSSLGDFRKPWICSWGCSLLDDVAPDFRQILEENYISSSPLPVDTNENRSIWWKWRNQLNNRLMALLRDIEESWFGPWNCLLLGEPIDCKLLDDVMRRLIGNLRNYDVEANESLLRIIFSSHSIAHSEACLSQLLSYKGWFGHGECCSRIKGRVLFTSASNDEEESFDGCRKVILNALTELVNQGKAEREPMVLVLDVDAQMLPWESLPVLRNGEVYRMPSVGSISVLIDRWRSNNESLARESLDDGGLLPYINLFDTYYLLNPGGDLSNTQKEFEEWFQSQNWESRSKLDVGGKLIFEGVSNAVQLPKHTHGSVPVRKKTWASPVEAECFFLKTRASLDPLLSNEGKTSVPTENELTVALQKHDLFLYFGHGSGEQYLSRHKIEMLDRCAAALLMGCSSGSLSYKGCYLPKGVPLAYLVAGCPTIIANLWDVTDKDIDKLSKELLKSWLEKEPTVSDVQEDLQNLRINSTKSRKRVPRGNLLAANSQKESCTFMHRNSEKFRVASFMGKARDACKLPYLIGASSVCYGVPTVIRKNKQ